MSLRDKKKGGDIPLKASSPTNVKKDVSDAAKTVASSEDDAICLKAKMSLLNGITVIVGSIIGSGIFVSPTGVLQYTGSVNMSLIVWTVSGIFSMVRANIDTRDTGK